MGRKRGKINQANVDSSSIPPKCGQALLCWNQMFPECISLGQITNMAGINSNVSSIPSKYQSLNCLQKNMAPEFDFQPCQPKH